MLRLRLPYADIASITLFDDYTMMMAIFRRHTPRDADASDSAMSYAFASSGMRHGSLLPLSAFIRISSVAATLIILFLSLHFTMPLRHYAPRDASAYAPHFFFSPTPLRFS